MVRKKVLMGLLLAMVLLFVSGCADKPQNPTEEPAQNSSAPDKVPSGETGPFKGMQAPDFVLKDMSGTEWKLSELKGNSVALVFFTSW